MTAALLRKARHVLSDPVLRRWLVRRGLGREKSPAGFVAGKPPYLAGMPVTGRGDAEPHWAGEPVDPDFGKPENPVTIHLPNAEVRLQPDDPGALFAREYADLETRLAAHRFAWLPLTGDTVGPDWVAALWECWANDFGDGSGGWPWHAYTAAERAINIIDFARRHGLPGARSETLSCLAHHADVIRENLEYFGEHYTSNHLSNNGRGLLRIGTALDLADHAETGARIMVAEAARIFGRSGVLREGSTHYHLLITRNYIDAWLEADAAGLSQAGMLRDVAARAISVIPGMCLPGGMPLIGDISPDVPPPFLRDLMGETGGWSANLSRDRQTKARALVVESASASPDRLSQDGWHRFGAHDWSALAYVPPDGWPPMPGHGHHDLGSFELHDGDTPVIVDPGRGSYADTSYVSANIHSGLTVDDKSPTPENRPYYSPAFRSRVLGERPRMTRLRDGRSLQHDGFSRLRGVGGAEREWRFGEQRLEILDRVDGRGSHRVCRRIFVAGDASIDETGVRIGVGRHTYRLTADAPPKLRHAPRWTAYGESAPANLIEFEHSVTLPFTGTITLERH